MRRSAGVPWRLPAPPVFLRLGRLVIRICPTARSGVGSARSEMYQVVDSGGNGGHVHVSNSAVDLQKVDVDVVDRVQAREGTTREQCGLQSTATPRLSLRRHGCSPANSSPLAHTRAAPRRPEYFRGRRARRGRSSRRRQGGFVLCGQPPGRLGVCTPARGPHAVGASHPPRTGAVSDIVR
jgi:hypothetical protein